MTRNFDVYNAASVIGMIILKRMRWATLAYGTGKRETQNISLKHLEVLGVDGKIV